MCEQNVFLSRWGFHPVDYATFLKLKRLKKLYWAAVKAWADWRRWDRKTYKVKWKPRTDRTQKRERSDIPIPEPKVCPVWKGNIWAESNILPDQGLLAAFNAARRPKAKAEDVKPLTISLEQIDKWLEEAGNWYNQK